MAGGARRHVALVTGANRGLGLETSRQLLARGLNVVLAGRNAEALDRALDGLSVDGAEGMTVQLDVTDAHSVTQAHRLVAERFGQVDVLVNNAAVLEGEDDDVLEIRSDVYRSSFDSNVIGAINVCREFVPDMICRSWGRIVNVSSGAGQLSSMSTYAPAYSVSKTALNALTRILASTYREHGILVNAADPGWVRTSMGGPSAPRSPEEGADTIVWLATLPEGGPTGGFFRDRKPIAW